MKNEISSNFQIVYAPHACYNKKKLKLGYLTINTWGNSLRIAYLKIIMTKRASLLLDRKDLIFKDHHINCSNYFLTFVFTTMIPTSNFELLLFQLDVRAY